RNFPALIFGILYALSISLFLLGPTNFYLDILSMVLFGLSLGVLLVYLGGLMAVDICSKEASGTALGIVGIASYLAAAIQEIISGQILENTKTIVDGQVIYNFDSVSVFWIGSAVVSLVMATFVWNAKPEK
ncbi:MAG: OPA family sugar phosphate sensor protein UhpC-like MFS transporter, partial [Oceanospirillaceae bacterium]